MSTATLASPAVSEFAAAVRAALVDLAPDEIDELTDGLEADLTDRLSDTDGAELGDPRAYAEELRAAAGLPHRPVRRAGLAAELAGVRHAPKIVAAALRGFADAHPIVGRAQAFVITLRPLWWLFRAVVVTALVVNGLRPGWWTPVNGLTVVAGIAALVLSVQFGRGKWLPFAWMRGLLLAVNVILVICAPFLVAGAATAVNNAWYSQAYAAESSGDMSGTGLLENGSQVANIFAYDAQGHPLTDVQLFDQDGKPLDLSGDPAAAYRTGPDGTTFTVPSDAVAGRPGWNVFPLAHVGQNSIADDGTIMSTAHRIPAELPFAMAKALAGSEAGSGPTSMPTPSPTASPTAAPTPAPTPAP